MKRLISLAISLGVLAIIYWRIDTTSMIAIFRQSHIGWMIAAVLVVLPLIFLAAWRFQQVIPVPNLLSIGESTRLVLIASVLNMVLPSKMGDIAKAYFVRDRSRLDGSSSLSLVVYDKAWDMLSLLLWCLFGLAVYPDKGRLWLLAFVSVAGAAAIGFSFLASPSLARHALTIISWIAPRKVHLRIERIAHSWIEIQDHLFRNKVQLLKVASVSMLVWFFHLTQIWLFTLVVRSNVPFTANLALAPLSILAGLVPLTFAGIGTRDAAIILFYGNYMSAPAGAALGLLCTSRYLLPALLGLPFLSDALAAVRTNR